MYGKLVSKLYLPTQTAGTNFKLILLDCGGEEPTLTQEPNDIIVNLYE